MIRQSTRPVEVPDAGIMFSEHGDLLKEFNAGIDRFWDKRGGETTYRKLSRADRAKLAEKEAK
jgi:hypothetical protein